MNILAYFSNNGVPATSLIIPTIKIREIPIGTLLVNGDSMTEIGDGFYSYDFVDYDLTKDYAIICDGTSTLNDADRYVYAGNENYINDIENSNLSTQILGVSAQNVEISNTLTLIPTASALAIDDIADAVWNQPTSANNGINTFGNSVNNINNTTESIYISVTENQNYLKRIVGLSHENIFIDNPIYDGDGNLTSARLRIYSTPGDVGTDLNIIGEYQISAPGDGPGRFTSWQQIRTS